MKILIAGDGQTGAHLAEMLSVENQDVTLMGADRERLQELDSTYNFLTSRGNPTSVEDLRHSGADNADIFIAVTPDENVNIVACELAKWIGASRCVARIDNPELASGPASEEFRRLGVDMTIYPERMAADSIKDFIRHNWVTDWFTMNRGELLVVGIRVTAGHPLRGHRLRDIADNPRFFHVAAIKRGDRAIIPRGDDCIEAGDILYVSLLPADLLRLEALCGCSDIKPGRIMITGAGRITENLLRSLGRELSVTVVDPDPARCREIAFMFPDAVVVNARSNDITAMKEEGIETCDMFLALSGSSEANIVACMVARQHGVRKIIARIEDFQYMEEAESLAIDKIINKKQLNTGMVMNMLLGSDASKTQCIALDKAEVAVIEASEESRIVSRTIGELSLPKGLTIAGIMRDGKGMLAEGRTQVLPGDRVVVFFLTGELSRVRKLFK